MWVPLRLKEEFLINDGAEKISIPFSGLAEGCIGVMLVFDAKENAKDFAAEKYQVVQVKETSTSA